MHGISKHHSTIAVFMCAAAALLVAALLYFRQVNIERGEEYTLNSAQERLNTVLNNLQFSLKRSLEYNDMLSNLVQSNPNVTYRDFQSLGKIIVNQNDSVTVIELAPRGIVRFVYPLAGHESQVNFNLLTDAEHSSLTIKAIQERRQIMQGPLVDPDGSTLAIYSRLPVHLNGQFWGLCIVAINLEKLLSTSGIIKNDPRYSYLVRIHSNLGGKNLYEWGDRTIAEQGGSNIVPPLRALSLNGQTWELGVAVRYPEETTSGWSVANDAFIAALALLMMLLLYRHLKTYFMVRTMSITDSLTGLLNHTTFIKRLSALIKQGGQHALFIIDLNDFKSINDTYGHPAGDEVICEVARRLRQTVRSDDLVARIGGDEFALILLNVRTADMVGDFDMRLREMMRTPITYERYAINATLSSGYAISPRDGENAEDLYAAADERMYEIKHNVHKGRGSAHPHHSPHAADDGAKAPETPGAETAPTP